MSELPHLDISSVLKKHERQKRRHPPLNRDRLEFFIAINGSMQALADFISVPAQRAALIEGDWQLFARYLRSHSKKLPWRPRLESLSLDQASNADRVQLAQHEAARATIARQDNYRKQHRCARIKAAESTKMLKEEMRKAARRYRTSLSQLSEAAVRTVIKNIKAGLTY
jgi:hypothetical protein